AAGVPTVSAVSSSSASISRTAPRPRRGLFGSSASLSRPARILRAECRSTTGSTAFPKPSSSTGKVASVSSTSARSPMTSFAGTSSVSSQKPDEPPRPPVRDWRVQVMVSFLRRSRFWLLTLFFATVTNLAIAGDTATQGQAGKHRYTNRLINSADPYLLLHAHNPVDWYPWGPEALA